MVGGETFTVSVATACNIGDVENKIREVQGLGTLFYLVDESGTILGDACASLPPSDQLSCIMDDPSPLCTAAQNLLKTAMPKTVKCDPCKLQELHLGAPMCYGSFSTREWKDDSRMANFMEYHDYNFCDYHVWEMILIDGQGKQIKLLGVINDGDADCNSGMWGSIYLRPGFKEIGGIKSTGDTESTIDITDDTWYTAPDPPLRPCKDEFCGGRHAKTPPEIHIAHAIRFAYRGNDDDDDDD